MEKQIQRERALAEAEGRIKEQQENEDSNRCQAILQETKVVIQASGKMCDHVGGGTLAIVTDADLLFRIAGLSSSLLLGFSVPMRHLEWWGGQLSDGLIYSDDMDAAVWCGNVQKLVECLFV